MSLLLCFGLVTQIEVVISHNLRWKRESMSVDSVCIGILAGADVSAVHTCTSSSLQYTAHTCTSSSPVAPVH